MLIRNGITANLTSCREVNPPPCGSTGQKPSGTAFSQQPQGLGARVASLWRRSGLFDNPVHKIALANLTLACCDGRNSTLELLAIGGAFFVGGVVPSIFKKAHHSRRKKWLFQNNFEALSKGSREVNAKTRSVMEFFKDKDWTVRLRAIQIYQEFSAEFSEGTPEVYEGARALRKLFKDKGKWGHVRSQAISAYGDLSTRFSKGTPEAYEEARALRELIKDEDLNVQYTAIFVYGQLSAGFSEGTSEVYEAARALSKFYKDEPWDGDFNPKIIYEKICALFLECEQAYEVISELLKAKNASCLKHIPAKVLFRFLEFQCQKHRSPEAFPIADYGIILDLIPRKMIRDFAGTKKETLFRLVARYALTGLPYDVPSLWVDYVHAEDREAFVANLRERSQSYRRGEKAVDVSDKDSLRLGYLSLDRPSLLQDNFENPGFSWDLYQQRMQASHDWELSSYLQGTYFFSLHRQKAIHEKLDKGGLKAQVAHLLACREVSQVHEAILNLVRKMPGPIKKPLRDYFQTKHGLANDTDYSREDSLKKVKDLFEGKGGRQVLVDVLDILLKVSLNGGDTTTEILLLYLAWEKSGEETRSRLVKYTTLKAPTGEDEIAALRDLAQVYGDGVGEALKAAQLDASQIVWPPTIRKNKKWQQEQLKIIEGESELVSQVEVIFGKQLSDQFFGYVAEDCTKNRGEEIRKPGFQIARILVDGVLEGVIDIQDGTHEGKRALTVAIGVRERANLNQHELLAQIENVFEDILSKNPQYDFVLIPTSEAEQGNRVETRQAINGRGYSTTEFQNKDSKLFGSQTYYVMKKR